MLFLGMKLVSALIRVAKNVHVELDNTQVCKLITIKFVLRFSGYGLQTGTKNCLVVCENH